MDIGIPKEVRAREHRVALTPLGVKALVGAGHRVFVETGAGAGAGHADGDYESAGARLVYSRLEAYARAELALGVIAPEPAAYDVLRPGQAVLAFWMLPTARAEDVRQLQERGVTAVGLEVIEDDDGQAPVLTAMSEIAGRLAVVIGSGLLLNEFGGKGIVMSGAPGVPPANLVVLGAGVLGRAAAGTALGMGAQVTLLDRSVGHLRSALAQLRAGVPSMVATPPNVERALAFADLVVASPAARGERAPQVVTRAMLRRMRPRSIFMDLAIDMGGCCEVSRPTAFPHPLFESEGVLLFCVPNLPSTAARAATLALTSALLPYLLPALERGFDRAALTADAALARGTYLYRGACVKESLARTLGIDYTPLPDRPATAH